MKEPRFPLVDAILITPEDSSNGKIAICSNATMAPGQVLGEVEPDLAPEVAVVGSLKVNRDGTERMIVNSLVHPSLQDLILFGTETSSFRPSSNLLQALQYGVDVKDVNRIVNGHNSNAQYPNLDLAHIDAFRDGVRVLPIFMSETSGKTEIVDSYLDWLAERTDKGTVELLRKLNSRPNKIYFDALNQLVRHLGGQATREKIQLSLDAADFQQLQPPQREAEPNQTTPNVPFKVEKDGSQIKVELSIGNQVISIRESDPFLLGYSLLKHIGELKDELSPLEQLTLGAEVARICIEINNAVTIDSPFGTPTADFTTSTNVNTESSSNLRTDSKYYYMVSIKDSAKISVMCMAHDQCESVYEIRGDNAIDVLAQLAEDNRFEDYEMDFLHRFDIGMQVGRADVAMQNGLEFVQDFDNVFEVNTSTLPFLQVEGDNFLAVHHDLLRDIYTRGLTAEHGDRQKGLARSAAVLAIFRSTEVAFDGMPRVYMQGGQTTEQMRLEYQKQLLRQDHDGSYSYGERTRTYFGFDQLDSAVDNLSRDPSKAYIVQRFDPIHDMAYGVDPETGQPVSSEDPCLTHDILFVVNDRVHSFHIARAHNTVNAYPENLFGLHDAYDTQIASELGLSLGDMFMLSSRANILLLTEEQKARRIISMPVKPMDDADKQTGPNKVGPEINPPDSSAGVLYSESPLYTTLSRPNSDLLDRLEDMNGVDIISRATSYLRDKGSNHNNAIIGTFLPDSDHRYQAQAEHLAFFQANNMGGKLYATAVFTNRAGKREEDIELANYLATIYATELGLELGDLIYFNIQGDEN